MTAAFDVSVEVRNQESLQRWTTNSDFKVEIKQQELAKMIVFFLFPRRNQKEQNGIDKANIL